MTYCSAVKPLLDRSGRALDPRTTLHSFFNRTAKEPAKPRLGQTIPFEIKQEEDGVKIRSTGIGVHFIADGAALPQEVDASFAIWALLPMAMQEGFNLHFDRPLDPVVVANAQLSSRIWEMWVPGLFRSVTITGEGTWSRPHRERRPVVQLFSGGIDSTFSLLQNRDRGNEGFALTVCGVDQVDESNIDRLVEKTDPLLRQLNCRRIVVRNNAYREPPALTIQYTLASTLFLLSDLFERGTLAADSSHAEDMAMFPWGTNHVTNAYLTGSDFSVQNVGAGICRTEKVGLIARAGLDLRALTFCRRRKVLPENCGVCRKCIGMKAMFLVATGQIPLIFVDNSLDENMMRELSKKYSDRTELFDIYFYAKDRDLLDMVPGLVNLIEECRLQGARELALKAKSQ